MKKTTHNLILIVLLLWVSAAFAKHDEDNYNQINSSVVIDRLTNQDIDVLLPSLILKSGETTIKLKFKNIEHPRLLINENKISFIINGEDKQLEFVNGETSFKHSFSSDNSLSIYTEDFGYSTKVTAYPLWVFILPIALILVWIVIKRFNNKKES